MTENTTETTDESTADEPVTDGQSTDVAETPTDATEPAEGTETDETTFSRQYVQELRQEAADNRVRAQDRDDLAQRLHTATVAATGRLADPTDLAYEESHLDDPEALTAAIDELLTRKPHLASRKVNGDVGQGASGAAGSVDLAGLLRART